VNKPYLHESHEVTKRTKDFLNSENYRYTNYNKTMVLNKLELYIYHNNLNIKVITCQRYEQIVKFNMWKSLWLI
jgi:hypothetical protein